MSQIVLRAENLQKRYGDTVALRGIDLEIEAGGVVGLVGPNGAGKTTLVEIAEGLRAPTTGRITVFGRDPADVGSRLRERIGVQLQATSLPDRLRVGETLELFASFYEHPRPVEDVLAGVGLDDAARQFTDTLSGGQRQRLSLGMALVHDPELLLLDEPTTGLDPEARRRLHSDIEALRDEGRTVLLTTHYIEEAEELCDRVLMIRDGALVADGAPFELVRRAGGEAILWLAVDGELDPAPLLEAGVVEEGRRGAYRRFRTPDPVAAIEALGPIVREQGLAVEDLRLKRPTLEDLYLELMGSEAPVPAPGTPDVPSGGTARREPARRSSPGEGAPA